SADELSTFISVLNTIICCGQTQDAVLTIEPNWSTFYAGEFVTFICDMNEGKDSDWYYQLRRNGEEFFPHQPHKNFRVQELDTGYSGEFQCCGYRMSSSSHSKCSKAVTVILIFVSITADKPRATLTAGPTTIPVGGSVTLSCSVEPSAGWKYKWFRRTKNSPEVEINTNNKENRNITVRQGGIYMCDGERGNPSFYSHRSHDVTIEITFSNKVVVTRRPNWPQMFSGEMITLTCEVQGGETTEWTCEWRGIYICEGVKGNHSFYRQRSRDATIEIIFSNKVVVTQQPNWPQIFSGETITLTCEVQGGETTEWTCEWRRDGSIIHRTNSKDWTFNASESSSGDYMCQCRSRDDSYSSTQWSEAITVTVSSSSHLVLLIVGPVVGFILLILLVLLCFCRRSKGLFCSRCKASESSRNDGVNQTGGHEYGSPPQG
ncbi:uncharacterized protein LOC106962000, partial [Poecilia latipinna]|uniref:uncharacterized protein LOC106962000 n=1 Tax=Poecilia latipinna TaxID=48699 RepID=UPI00072E6ABB